MADAPDPLWDGTPHWEQEPEVAEKYILYLDKNVEAGQWYQLAKIFFCWPKTHDGSLSPSTRLYFTSTRYNSARGVFLDTNGPNHHRK